MKRKRFTEEQIITILKENEADSTVVDLARHHGVAENTISVGSRSTAAWKSPMPATNA